MKTLLIATLAAVAAMAADLPAYYTTHLATNVMQRPSGPPHRGTNGVERTLVTVTNVVIVVNYEGADRTFVLKQLSGAVPMQPRSERTNNVPQRPR